MITVRVKDDEARRELQRLQSALSDRAIAEFLENDVHPYFSAQIAQRFDTDGDRASGRWWPLAAATLRIKSALGYPLDINERTGAMRQHVVHNHAVAVDAAGVVLAIPGESPGLMEKKIRTAQEGSRAGDNPFGGRGTPPRPVLAVSPMDALAIQGLFNLHIKNWKL